MTVFTSATAPITAPRTVDKPWGKEEIWAHNEGSYCGKRITVRAGQALSLQYHEQKHETMFVVSGAGSIDLGATADELSRYPLAPGDVIEIPTGRVHRLRAADSQDIVVMEASTTHLTDVVRLSDQYGREGHQRLTDRGRHTAHVDVLKVPRKP